MAKQANNEIDLLELTVKLYLFIKRKLKFLLFFLIAGIIIGIVKHYISRPFYETYLVANSNIISNNRIVDIINTLQPFIGEKNIDSSSGKLKTSINILKQIKNIEATIIEKEENELFELNCYKIDLQIYDNSMIDSIRYAIINLINSNNYIKKKTTLKRENILKLISKINEEIKGLDSLEQSLLSESKNFIIIDGQNEIVNLLEKKHKLEEEFQLTEAINIIEDFTVLSTPANKSISVHILIYGLIFLVIGFFVAIFIEVKKKVGVYVKKV